MRKQALASCKAGRQAMVAFGGFLPPLLWPSLTLDASPIPPPSTAFVSTVCLVLLV